MNTLIQAAKMVKNSNIVVEEILKGRHVNVIYMYNEKLFHIYINLTLRYKCKPPIEIEKEDLHEYINYHATLKRCNYGRIEKEQDHPNYWIQTKRVVPPRRPLGCYQDMAYR